MDETTKKEKARLIPCKCNFCGHEMPLPESRIPEKCIACPSGHFFPLKPIESNYRCLLCKENFYFPPSISVPVTCPHHSCNGPLQPIDPPTVTYSCRCCKYTMKRHRTNATLHCPHCRDILVEESIETSALDKQVGGNHYKDKGIQPIHYIHANKLNFFEGSAIKYITRHRDKNGAEDIKKAIHYLEMLLELEYPDVRN